MTDLTRGRSHNVLRYSGNPLDIMFSPRSVAVIGASEREGSIGRTIISNLVDGDYAGEVFAVNPYYFTLLDRPSYARISDVPHEVDLALIATPPDVVAEVMAQCVRAGVKSCVIHSAGFKETGPVGAARQKEVLKIAHEGQIRVVGPNSLGIMNPYNGLNASFAARMALPGNVGFASQSGALFTAILDWSISENVGFSSFVDTGAMADVDWGDLIYYFGDDSRTKSILIFMETIGDARSFMSAAREVALTKPIIVMMPGRSAAAARAAAAHTGAETSDDAAMDAAFRRCGVLRVETIAELFDLAEVLAKQPRPLGPRLTIVTNAGGPAVSATDALISAGGQLARLSKEVEARLDDVLPTPWSHNNPIDILGDADAERYRQAIELVAKDKESDGLLVILTPQAMTQDEETAVALQTIFDRPAGYPYGKPVLASWMGGGDVAAGTAVLNQANIPTFAYPDNAARLFTYMWRYHKRLRSLYETPYLPTDVDEASLKRFLGSELIEEVRRTGRTILTDYESKQLLQAHGIPVLEEILAQGIDAALTASGEVGFPLRMVAYSTDQAQLAEGIMPSLLVEERAQVREGYTDLEGQLPPGAFEGVVLQPAAEREPGYSLRLSAYPDANLGPVLSFGLGGALGARVADRALGIPPLNTTLARRMMEPTRVYEAMMEDEQIDRQALENLLVRFSQLVVQQRWIKRIEVDPLLVTADERLALRARIELYGLKTTKAMLPQLAIRPYPYQYVEVFTNRDGIEFVIRPIRPEDEPLMVDFHARLSEESVYLRYFRAFDLSQRVEHERLTRLCFIDYDRTIALVIVWHNPATEEPEIVAVGRLTRMPDPVEAEYAILVRDDFQGKGLGTILLQRLLQVGRDEGLERVIAFMLPANSGMINISKKLGFHFEREDDLQKAVIDLQPQDEADQEAAISAASSSS